MAAKKNINVSVPTEALLSVNQLTVDPSLNVRMRKGSEVYGVKIQNDGYDLDTMIAQVLERGKILEAIHVSLRKDGTYVVLRGNRRTLAGQSLLSNPDLADDIRKELNATRVLVFKELTAEEEREKIMDQNSKSFSRSEMIRYAWSLRQQGQSFERIAVDNFEMWGQFGRNARTLAKLADIRAIPAGDIDTRRKAIKTWLRGTVDEYVIPAFDLGPVVQKACMLSEMELDGLLKGTDDKPYFYTTRDPQSRLKKLGQAREKDGSKWTHQLGGENFNAQIEEYHKTDFPTAGAATPAVETPKKRPSVAELKVHMGTAQSSPARMAYSIAIGSTEPEFISRDQSVSLLEAKETLFLQFAETLKPDASVNLRDILTQIFLRDNILDFKQMLEKHSNAAPIETAPNNEAPKGADSEVETDSDTTETGIPEEENGTFPLVSK
jgi:hypothetical protein